MSDQLERFEDAQEQAERAHAQMICDATCGDCEECVLSPDPNTRWGWCLQYDDYVELNDIVADIDCDHYHGRN